MVKMESAVIGGATHHIFKFRRPSSKIRSECLEELAGRLRLCFEERRGIKLCRRAGKCLDTKQRNVRGLKAEIYKIHPLYNQSSPPKKYRYRVQQTRLGRQFET